jgi:pyruvate dehydrogenase E1 component alpha subunit
VAPTLHNEDLVGMLCEMIKARIASDRLWSLQRQGRIGTIAPINGQEATTVGATWALDPAHDWVLPQYREPMALGRYGPEVLRRFAAWALGHPQGGHLPEPIRVFPPQISLATQILHAVGIAWALKLQREPGVALVFFGDGSSSEGDFYEAGNVAGVLEVPVIFLCVNNQWAISTPTSRQTASAGFAAKADAFGIPGVTVDGNDPVAMFEVVSAARQRALEGKGATLIEAVTYRLGAHTTADDPTRYVPEHELAEAQARDPLEVFRRQLENRGIWDRSMQSDAEQAGERAIDEAWSWASNLPLRQSDLFEHVFATPTERQRSQRAALENFLAGPST